MNDWLWKQYDALSKDERRQMIQEEIEDLQKELEELQEELKGL
jgi:F0F1-type ATP synthase membrane subunit b/b'